MGTFTEKDSAWWCTPYIIQVSAIIFSFWVQVKTLRKTPPQEPGNRANWRALLRHSEEEQQDLQYRHARADAVYQHRSELLIVLVKNGGDVGSKPVLHPLDAWRTGEVGGGVN